MKIFELDWSFGNNPIIEGNHKWVLPGVECDHCGDTWGAVGCEYPGIDISILGDTKPYGDALTVPLKRFLELKNRIKPLVPANLPLFPGTHFGPIVGKALDEVGDFAWTRGCTPLITHVAAEKLMNLGIKIKCVPSDITLTHETNIKLLALHIEPRAVFHEKSLRPIKVCSGCGSIDTKLKAKYIVKKESIPTDADMFRVCWHTMGVLASERFVDAVHKLRLTDIAFKEMPIAE